MRLFPFILLFSLFLIKCSPPVQTTFASFDEYPVYDGDDLGITYTSEKTIFKFWSPAAQSVKLDLYYKDIEEQAYKSFDMKRGEDGVWTWIEKRDLVGMYFTYTITQGNKTREATADPYSVACGRNGERSQIIDLEKTNPEGWENDKNPSYKSPNDRVIYEIHVRDMSISEDSGIKNKGKLHIIIKLI